jgi:hypothetical protein
VAIIRVSIAIGLDAFLVSGSAHTRVDNP